MRRLWVLALVAGCYNEPAFAPCFTACASDGQCPSGLTCGDNGYCRLAGAGDCSPTRDAAPIDMFVSDDAPIDTPNPAEVCYGNGLLRVCLDPLPANIEMITSLKTIDTSNTANCTLLQPQTDGPTVCVITARDYTITTTGRLRVIGSRPFAILATNAIAIQGELDVSSKVDGGPGAGANSTLCAIAAVGANGSGNMGGGGGGAGGALTSPGGRGGAGAGGVGVLVDTPPTTVVSVRGGCAGARGGNYGGFTHGVGGNGGGAIYLIAGTSMLLSGVINASGSGGYAPEARAGGGGGGSGGFIGLDAMSYSINGARIFAIGGSGSSGGDTESGGNPGNEARSDGDPSTTPAVGCSGEGGAGGSTLPGDPGQPAGTNTGCGGGGGGGGGGFIGVDNLAAQNFSTASFRPMPVGM